MKGEWCYFKSYFTPEICNKILEDALKLPEQNATLGVEGKDENEQFRRSKIRFIQKSDPTFTWLFDEMWKMAIWANNDWFGFHISKMDYIQLAEYDESNQGEYKKHHDIFWMNNDTEYHRKLSAVIQLSDPNDYEGGELEFFDLSEYPNATEIKQQGSVVFFPSFLYHQANPVTKGKRYSLACWFDGKKWT